MTYIFGYGSLLFTPGINGRTRKSYDDCDLTEAWLFGYRRDWNAVWHGSRYLGLSPDKSSTVNGVIFHLPDDCFNDFAITEGSEKTNPNPIYKFVDVRKQIGIFPDADLILTPKDRILTCVTINPSYEYDVPSYYKTLIDRALEVRGTGFKTEFWSSTPRLT